MRSRAYAALPGISVRYSFYTFAEPEWVLLALGRAFTEIVCQAMLDRSGHHPGKNQLL